MTSVDGEVWAELFGDAAGMESFGLQNATTADARARLYRRLERPREAVGQWREALELVATPWDRVALLRELLVDAAEVPLPALDAVAAIDRLRGEIEAWSRVGLGRRATEACYALAAATDDVDVGRQVWCTAERWRAGLESFSLAGLQVAIEAAARWGTAGDLQRLTASAEAERERIQSELR